tara:strand:- start:510 stop:1016 length:507 start_codon:yes stop_codon:yes gene_type:complete
MIILRSTDTAPEITPIDGMAWHYVWELLEFGTFKNGYACHAYSNGRHGGYERVMWCLRDVEDAFGYGRGELHARVWRMKLGENDEVLAAEQFVHARNRDDKAMLYDKRWLEVGGKSEFYFCDQKTALARFTNSYRKRNLELGAEIVAHKRDKKIHGVPLPRVYSEVTA